MPGFNPIMSILHSHQPYFVLQEGYLAKYAVNEEDRQAAEDAQIASNRPQDPMQGLEELDVAGPKPESSVQL